MQISPCAKEEVCKLQQRISLVETRRQGIFGVTKVSPRTSFRIIQKASKSPRTSFRDLTQFLLSGAKSQKQILLSEMSNITPVFVEGLNLDGPIRVGSSRVYHQKSRTGCQRCKSRRVKVRSTSSH